MMNYAKYLTNLPLDFCSSRTVFYVEATNEFVVLSTDGYIRTYFLPDGGKRYFDRQ